jgi:hypothetical protein
MCISRLRSTCARIGLPTSIVTEAAAKGMANARKNHSIEVLCFSLRGPSPGATANRSTQPVVMVCDPKHAIATIAINRTENFLLLLHFGATVFCTPSSKSMANIADGRQQAQCNEEHEQ